VAAIAILTRMVAVSADESRYLAHVLVALSIICMTVCNLAAGIFSHYLIELARSASRRCCESVQSICTINHSIIKLEM